MTLVRLSEGPPIIPSHMCLRVRHPPENASSGVSCRNNPVAGIMSQRMRSNRLAKAGETMSPLAGGLNGGSRYRLTRVAAREQPFLRVCRLPVAAQNIQQLG